MMSVGRVAAMSLLAATLARALALPRTDTKTLQRAIPALMNARMMGALEPQQGRGQNGRSDKGDEAPQ